MFWQVLHIPKEAFTMNEPPFGKLNEGRFEGVVDEGSIEHLDG